MKAMDVHEDTRAGAAGGDLAGGGPGQVQGGAERQGAREDQNQLTVLTEEQVREEVNAVFGHEHTQAEFDMEESARHWHRRRRRTGRAKWTSWCNRPRRGWSTTTECP